MTETNGSPVTEPEPLQAAVQKVADEYGVEVAASPLTPADVASETFGRLQGAREKAEVDMDPRLKRVIALKQSVFEKRMEMLEAQEIAKDKKKVYEAEVESLLSYINGLSQQYPLFDRQQPAGEPAADGPDAAAPPAPEESWRDVPISDLGPLGIPDGLLEALVEQGLHTIGLLADYTASDKRLTDLKGVGPAKAEKIEHALERFWAARKPAGDDEGGGEIAEGPIEKRVCNRCNQSREPEVGVCPNCGSPEFRLEPLVQEAG